MTFNSLRLSKVDSTTRGAPLVASESNPFASGVVEKKLKSPASIRLICPRTCEKSSSRTGTECAARSGSKGDICSRSTNKCLMANSRPSTSLDWFIICLLAAEWFSEPYVDGILCKPGECSRIQTPCTRSPDKTTYSQEEKPLLTFVIGN